MESCIKNLRENAGLSKEDLAEMLGVHFNTIDNWEDGTTEPRASQIKRLAEIFGSTVEEVIGLPDAPSAA